jgi:uncharacterized protein YecT (DUF1311 family)
MRAGAAAAAIAVCFTAGASAAAPATLHPDCFAPITNSEDDASIYIERACAKPRYDAAQAQVKALYDKLYTAYDADDRTRLAAAQQAWLKFRDDECELETRDYTGGSMYRTVLSACYLGMTRDRIAHLKALAECDPGPCVP